MKTLLDKTYSDESLYDAERDLFEAISEDNSTDIPKDERGFRCGTFRIHIIWNPE